MDYLNKVLENQGLVELILEVFALVFGLVWSWVQTQKWFVAKKDSKIVAIIEKAVQQVYDEFVREIKYGPDGKTREKLTVVQICEARDKAWAKAEEIAKAEGLNFAKAVTTEYWPILLDKVINGIKTKEHAK